MIHGLLRLLVLTVCQLYPSLSLSTVTNPCHCLQLPVPYPSRAQPHCLSLRTYVVVRSGAFTVPTKRTRTYSSQYCGQMTGAVSNIQCEWNLDYCMYLLSISEAGQKGVVPMRHAHYTELDWLPIMVIRIAVFCSSLIDALHQSFVRAVSSHQPERTQGTCVTVTTKRSKYRSMYKC